MPGLIGDGNLTHLRIVNGLYRGANAQSAVGVPIDYLIDSSTADAGVAGLGPNSVAAGDSANGYTAFNRGVHTFFARLAGDTAASANLYTTTDGIPFLPKVYFVGATYYTIVVAGVIPDTGKVPDSAVPVVMIPDDPYPGPRIHNVLQARFHLINAATFADSGGSTESDYVAIYVTPGSTPPADISIYFPLTYASFRYQSQAINLDPGTYTITVTSDDHIIAQQAFTFAEGEVQTLLLWSTGPSPTPSPANHTLTAILDHRYAP